jgi:aflatoxin B1 aldehyde reductase
MEPTIVLGTMTFGWTQSSHPVDDDAAAAQLDYFTSQGFNEIDTARMYAAGETENMLGRVLPGRDGVTVTATKANPFPPNSLKPDSLREQLETSLAAMNKDCVEIFYLHAPDPDTAIEETLAETQKLYEEGKFKQLGLSNYPSWEVVNIYHICLSKGYVLPTIYQGMYNALTREVEEELFPALKTLGIRFLAYNPLAAGVLTGKHNSIKQAPSGRFADNKMYLDRFWKETYLQLDSCVQACADADITMTDAAFRWLKYHSQLDPAKGDGIIIGASSMGHLTENVEYCLKRDPLPDAVVDALDAAWDNCRPDCPPYQRGYSNSAKL